MPAGTSNEVISAFNNGTRAIQAGNPTEAVERFKFVLSALPQFGPAHTGCGVALAKLGRNAEALAEFEKAHSTMPNDAQNLVQIAQMSALCGRNNEAVEYYKLYLSLYPTGQYAQMMRTNLSILQQEVGRASGGVSSQGQDNYLSDITTHYRNRLHIDSARWEQMPITVFIPNGTGVEGYRSQYLFDLAEAFTAWANATQGRVKIQFVKDPSAAVIKCKWTANPSDLQTPEEGGHAITGQTPQGVIKQADVVILTRNLQQPGTALNENALKFICLHEVGHALGLAGHSTQPGDIMFFGTNADVGNAPVLSDRDKKTLLMMYSR
jgi:tetratricopeptide (TPR) repeat protein